MKLANFTIDTVSLLAMTLVVGILVDDSIVVFENIERHHKEGEPPLSAAITGRSEIGFAAIVITLVDVVVFLPMAFLPGVVGRFLSEFGVVVVVATLTSLWTSFTVTPTLAGRWSLRSKWKPWRPIQRVREGIRAPARRGMRIALLPNALESAQCSSPPSPAARSSLSLSLLPLGLIGFTFIPSVDRGEIFVQITYPTGTPLTQVDAVSAPARHRCSASPTCRPDVAISGAYSSPFGGFLTEGNVGQIHLWLKDDRKHSTDYWVEYLKNKLRPLAPGATDVASSRPRARVAATPSPSTTS